MGRTPAEIALCPIFVGEILSTWFFGVLLCQVYVYAIRPKGEEKPWIKYFVGIVFLGDTINCIFGLSWLYSAIVIHSGDPSAYQWANWVFMTGPATTGIITGCVQTFYAWRVQVLTQKMWTVALILLCALTGLCCAIATAVSSTRFPEMVQWPQRFKVIVSLWLVSSVTADIVIAASLVWFLSKRRTGRAITDSVVNHIIKVTVQTGTLTALVAIVNLLLFVAVNNGPYLVFNIPLSKLYTISFMSMLNSRLNGTKGSNSEATHIRCQTPEVTQLTTIIPFNDKQDASYAA